MEMLFALNYMKLMEATITLPKITKISTSLACVLRRENFTGRVRAGLTKTGKEYFGGGKMGGINRRWSHLK